jgi:DNA-binding transcriptional ArsR family regulator
MAHASSHRPPALELPSALNSDAIADVCGALAHPTRVLVLAALTDGRASPARIARSHNSTIAAVAHHFRTLERARLLRPAGTQPNRGTIEHFYALTARGEALAGLLDDIAAATRNSTPVRPLVPPAQPTQTA